MRHRHYRTWRPHRKHHRGYRERGGYKDIAVGALQVVGVLATALVALLFKRKP